MKAVMQMPKTHPVAPMVLPKEVEKVGNGKLTPAMLKKVKCGGQMWTKAADAFNLMYDDALAAGHKLRNVGDFRPFADQMAMFKDRYDDKPTGRKPEITRDYDGKKWYLKPGKAPSSSPGKSNHGFGLAIDLGVDNKGQLASIGGTKAYDWMCDNAPNYGFYLQGAPTKNGQPNPEYEAWHWQYCVGDKTPDLVAQRLSGAAPAPAAPAATAAAAPAAPAKKAAKKAAKKKAAGG